MSKVTITIDGTETQVEKGINLIEAAKQIGIDIPHFCYHPGLTADGNCRMCLVQVEKMPKPVIGCKTLASEGMVVQTNSEAVAKMRRSIMEFMLINHPLDCPTCDQAGECKLQDYYMEYDRIPMRHKESKVQKRKMVDLGKQVMLDEERCVCCTRCVRFCQEIAKKEELYVHNRGNHACVSTFPNKPMSNAYAGCTVDVCPVGALTSKDFRYKKRVWYLSETDSICPGCSRGCNISIHHADRKVFRLKPRHNAEINHYWMCDEGRYDYNFINNNRCLKPAWRHNDVLMESNTKDALNHLKDRLSNYTLSQIAFIASPQESNESINDFVNLAKNAFDADHVYYSKNSSKNPTSDDFLITADKNPNLAHVEKLGLKPVNSLPADCKAVFVQRNLNTEDLKTIKDSGIEVIALYATNTTGLDSLAQTIFPIPTYAEQNGSFTNVDGIVQFFSQAFETHGHARPIQKHIEDLEEIARGMKLKKVG